MELIPQKTINKNVRFRKKLRFVVLTKYKPSKKPNKGEKKTPFPPNAQKLRNAPKNAKIISSRDLYAAPYKLQKGIKTPPKKEL